RRIPVPRGFGQPGVATRQVLEMSNVSGRTLLIYAGVRLLQIVLQRCEGSAVYQGRFARQDNLYPRPASVRPPRVRSLPRGHRPPRYPHGADLPDVPPRGTEALPMKNSVKVLRADRDWTQAQLAAALDVSRQTVNAIETGKNRSQSVTCLSSGAALGLSIEEIFDR